MKFSEIANDANGNTLTDAQGRSFTWDFENRLTQGVVPGTNGGTTTFKYDPFGRRIQKSGPLGTTNYLYDGIDDIEEVDGSGNILARYTQGKSFDEPFSQLRGTSTSYFEADGLGTITSLSNPAGAVAQTYVFDSFGNQTSSSGLLTNAFRYTAREFDPETNLYYYRARYYDPLASRFVSEDPLRLFSGINFYRYVFNSPANFIDPMGLESTCTYQQSTGAIRCVDSLILKRAELWHKERVTPATAWDSTIQPLQNAGDTGSLPQGSYDLGPPTNQKGPLTIPLRPRPGTNLGGRPGGFLIHGDNKARNHSASHGCIIQERNIRQAIADCGGGTVNVEQ